MTSVRGSFRSQAWVAGARGRRASFLAGEVPSIYFQEVGRVPLLTADEEVGLAQAIERGHAAARRLTREAGHLSNEELEELSARVREGSVARGRLAEANLRLVVRVARRYLHHGVALDDLIQEGNLGLVRAVDKFDWRQGFRFSSYASWWIHQAIARAVEDGGRTIRVPSALVRMVNRVGRMAGQLQQAYGREPSLAEISAALGLPAEQVRELLHLMPQMGSLDERVGEDEGLPLAELVPDKDTDSPEEIVERSILAMRVQDMLLALSPRERYVIQRRFGLGTGHEETLTEIGKEFGVSRERIRQLEVVALSKLRAPSRAQVSGFHLSPSSPLPRSRRTPRRGAPAREELGQRAGTTQRRANGA